MSRLNSNQGNFFEDFYLGQQFKHGVPRTITQADATLYLALTGSRLALHCAEPIAQRCGFNTTPLDNLLVFHVAFGKTVNDISLNAVANLGYAEIRFHRPCFAGDTLSVTSEVIGLKQNSSGQSGIVYVRSIAKNQFEQDVVSWIRWVMVVRQQSTSEPHSAVVPQFQSTLEASQIAPPECLNCRDWQSSDSDNQPRFGDFAIGDSIFHRDGITINDSDHSLATRLYQNNARVHFDQHMMNTRATPQRLVYGGHIISICHALSYNGLGNGLWLSGINGGSHANPCYAGDTIYCQSEILDRQTINGRDDLGLIRIRMLGLKNATPDELDYLYRDNNGRTQYHPNLVLDLDYWTLMLV